MAFTHTIKVKIGLFLKARIRIRSQTSGSESDQKGSGSATLTLGLEPEPHSNFHPVPDLFGRIRTSRTGSGSCLNKWLFINFFSECKSHKYLGNLCFLSFWVMNILFRANFPQKIYEKKFDKKLFRSGSGSGPDVFEMRIRIRSKIVQIRNTA
jgi:hypothetical protein